MNKITYVEFAVDDIARARAFYEGLFGWKTSQMPGSDYWIISMGEDSAIGGGMMKRQQPGQAVTAFVTVASVAEAAEKVKKLGGQLLVPRTAVQGMGWFAVCLDTEKNPFGLWQDDPQAQ